jgi:ADP-ribose pyrophosphatase YjhB (NUDIX family)
MPPPCEQEATVDGVAEDGVETPFADDGQDWLVGWYPPPEPPPGKPHGAAAICVAGDQIVLIGTDGERWGLPGGRPEAGERWIDTLRREVAEEACATVTDCRLLGFTRGTCIRGHEQGLVLVRSMWLAEVRIDDWQPQFEISHRRLVPTAEAFGHLDLPAGLLPLHRRAFAEAGLPASDGAD